MNCVFFGSPEFAVASLDALLASKHKVVGIITQPDRPAGRGLRLEAPAVKKRALEKGIPILQPEKVNAQETYDFLERVKPDVLAVVAYGEFLGSRLLSFCKTPPINVHPSLLPELRGAAPMQWALIRGHKKSGVTTQFMVKEMDAGDILLQKEEMIAENDTAKDLHDRWSILGGKLLVETLSLLEAGQLKPRAQDSSAASLAPLLSKEQGLIHWSKEDAQTIHNKVRGLFPWPSAHTSIQQKRVKILKTKISALPGKSPGELWKNGDQLFVGCKSGALEILELQPEGKRAMLPKEFLNGMQGVEKIIFDGE